MPLPPEVDRRLRVQFRVTAAILVALPLVIAGLMAATTPGYTRLLVTTWAGALISFAALALLIGAGLASVYVERRVRPLRRPIFMLPVLIFLIFPAAWAVLMGPAIVIVVSRR